MPPCRTDDLHTVRRRLNPTISCGIYNSAVGVIALDEGESKTVAVGSLLKLEYNLGRREAKKNQLTRLRQQRDDHSSSVQTPEVEFPTKHSNSRSHRDCAHI